MGRLRPEAAPMELFDAIMRNDPAGAAPALSALGVREPGRAFENLRRISFTCTPSQFGGLTDLVAETLPSCADPDQAVDNLERYAARSGGPLSPPMLAAERPFLMALFLRMFGYSQFMADFLVRYPHYAAWLGTPGLLERPMTVEEINSGIRDALGPMEGFELRQRAAIRWLRSMLVLLGARVMTGRADEREFMEGLSHCAVALIGVAIEQARADLEPRFGVPMEESGDGGISNRQAGFAVVAMGKLGAGELNFSSDIDLQFVYSAEGWTTGRPSDPAAGRVVEGRITNHDYFCRISERVTAFLGSSNDEGYLYRVDLRLRPDGDDGPLARSLPSFEAYHETQARPWERMAMIKAKGVAGDPELCRRFDSLAGALVFDRALGEDIVPHIRDLKWKIDSEVAAGEAAGREIKRGEGGIREIEFYVQALQIMHGGAKRTLRLRRTLDAIDALAMAGLVPESEAPLMKDDYIFLRIVEHRLQMMHLRQTHTLPADACELRALARRCGIADSVSEQDAGTRLMAQWEEIRARVHGRFDRFFGGAAAPSAQTASPAEKAARLIIAGAPEKDILPMLLPLGMDSPSVVQVLKRLGGQGRTTYLTEKGRTLYGAILPELIQTASTSARPESALAHLESLALAFGSFQSLYELFHSSPPLMRLLLGAFGAANAPAATLAAHPEYLDYLYDPEWLRLQSDANDLASRLWESLERIAGDDYRDTARTAAVLARVRRLEHLRVGLAEFAGAMDFTLAGLALSILADASLDACLRRARAIFDLPDSGGLAVMAMGKLGTRELNHHSDLDLVFCRSDSAPGLSPERWDEQATAAAAWIVDALVQPTPDGAPFSVDTRLRPEGASAPLAPPLSRFADYYASRADLWEFQSLLKVRCAAGTAALGIDFTLTGVEAAQRRLRGVDAQSGIVAPIRAMRARLEESARAPRWILCDFKKGFGGLMDLEFLAQAHQLAMIRRASDASDALGWIGLRADEVFSRLGADAVLNPDAAAELAMTYRLLRRLEARTRALFETDKSQIPADGEKWEALRRAAADLFPPEDRAPERMRDRILAKLHSNRRAFEEMMPKED